MSSMHVWNLDRYMSKKFCLNFQYYLKIVLGAWSLNFDGRNFKIFTMKITYVLWKIMLLWNFLFFLALAASFRVEAISQMIFLQNHSRKWLNRHNIKMLADGGQLALSKILAAPFHLIVITFYWWKCLKYWWIRQNRKKPTYKDLVTIFVYKERVTVSAKKL